MIDFIECEEIARYYERGIISNRTLDKSRTCVVDTNTGKVVGTVEEFRKITENLLNSRFNIRIGNESSFDLLFECKECGTFIWGGVDHRLDPFLKCPHCAGYQTLLPYWTVEDIATDYDKELEIAIILEHSEYLEADQKRYHEKQLHDWEYWKRVGNKWTVAFTVHSYYYTGLKDLTFHMFKTNQGLDKDEIIIPLTLSGMYNKWIYPHTKKAKEANKLPF